MNALVCSDLVYLSEGRGFEFHQRLWPASTQKGTNSSLIHSVMELEYNL